MYSSQPFLKVIFLFHGFKSQWKRLIKAILPSHPPNQTGMKQTMIKDILAPSYDL